MDRLDRGLTTVVLIQCAGSVLCQGGEVGVRKIQSIK